MENFLYQIMDKIYHQIIIIKQRHTLAEPIFDNGWFPINHISRVEKGPNESIDEFMERILESKYDQLKEYCLDLNPNRIEILQEAFNLYEKENYIACIPLFFTQIDGIAKDDKSDGVFAGKHNHSDPVKNRFLNNIYRKTNKTYKIFHCGTCFIAIDLLVKTHIKIYQSQSLQIKQIRN